MNLFVTRKGITLVLKGFPIEFHFSSLFLVVVFLFGNPIFGLAWLMLLCIHVLGHALLARYFKLPVVGVSIYPIAAECEHGKGESEWEDILVAWGGVAAQSLLALIGIVIAFANPQLANNAVWGVMVPLNLFIIFLNLMPIESLDGYKAWKILPLLYNKGIEKVASQ